jgi:2-deoxy-D-gluconate 3-dehydrogenase
MILDTFRLTGKNALVTGSRIGLGNGMALAVAEAGANLVIHGREDSGLEDVSTAARRAGVRAVPARADISDARSCADLIEFTVRELGSIDILVNNAGIIRRAPAVDYSEVDWFDVIETNLHSVFRLSQLACRHMLAQGSGKIINIASLLSFQGGIFVPAYAAAKGGVA